MVITLIEHFGIVGYCRISVDEEQDRDNTSIENQRAIIQDFVTQKFPQSNLTFFEDRDRSGYTFEQREGYQAMRRELMAHKQDILIIKDFSRFSRRNSRGLVELEDLRDAGARIISIGDNIDFPNDDDWLKIQFQFLINEMPVTDASKKVKSVIKRRQQDGKWICAAPYGYIVNKHQAFELVPTDADIVRQIFKLYNDGWGYKKIANHLTDEGIPTPRMSERQRKEAAGEAYRREIKSQWSIVTVQGILDNDFYIGTLRQGKYTRKKINGKDRKRDVSDHIVIENHHQPILDYRTFATTKALREKRSTSNYRGVKTNDNPYSGFLFCGDCGSPMFSMSRRDLKPAYTCGAYHRRGLKGCTSHHIRVDKLDELMKSYVRRVMEGSVSMLAQLNRDLDKEREDIAETTQSAMHLESVLIELKEELKATKRQRIRDMMKHPDQEQLLDSTYDELERDLIHRMEGLANQIQMTANKRNTILRVNRVAKTALDVFHDILDKEKLDRNDLELILDQVKIFQSHIEVYLKADIDTLIRCDTAIEASVAAMVTVGTSENFNQGIVDSLQTQLVQSAPKRLDKVYDVNVISNGDPLEIYTEKDGNVIFRKYSLLGGLSEFSTELCESLNRTVGQLAVITDRDNCISSAGTGKREILDRQISTELEHILESRQIYQHRIGAPRVPVCLEMDRLMVTTAAPILSGGDVIGAVLFAGEEEREVGDIEYALAQTIALFLGRHMET